MPKSINPNLKDGLSAELFGKLYGDRKLSIELQAALLVGVYGGVCNPMDAESSTEHKIAVTKHAIFLARNIKTDHALRQKCWGVAANFAALCVRIETDPEAQEAASDCIREIAGMRPTVTMDPTAEAQEDFQARLLSHVMGSVSGKSDLQTRFFGLFTCLKRMERTKTDRESLQKVLSVISLGS